MPHVLLSRKMLGVTLVIMMTVSFWAQPSWARNTPAPVVDATGAGGSGPSSSSSSSSSLEARLSRLETQTLLDLMERMDSLQNEVQRMLGEMEEQAHSMDSLNKRQRDLYLDIDQRLRKIEQGNIAAPAMGAFVPAPVPASTASMSPGSVASSAPAQTAAPGAPSDAQQERLSYEKAFGLLKDGRYDQAVVALTAFMKSYPQGRFAGNAQYWLGEANYAQRHFTLALKDFEKVVKNYPASPKRADAMLKMGYTYQELAQMDEARSSLQDVSKNYPNSTAANLAHKRLQELNRLR